MHYIVIPILAFFLANSAYSQPSAREMAPESPKQSCSIDELLDAYKKRKINKKMARESYRNCVETIVNDSSINAEEQKELVLVAFNRLFYPNTQINPDRLTLNKILEACSIWGDAAYADFLLHTMEGIWNIKPNSFSVNLTIKACRRPGELAYAWSILNEMDELWGIRPDKWSVTNTIKACKGHGETEYAEFLLDHMKEMWGISSDIYIYNHTIEAFSQFGDYIESHKLLIEMEKLGIHPNIYSLNYTLEAHLNAGDYQGALELFNDMEKTWKVKANPHTYSLFQAGAY